MQNLFLSLSQKTFMKNLLLPKTTVYLTIHHSYIANCKFHLVLIGSSLDQILQRLDKYHFTYQIVNCIYTLYKYRFYFNIISSRGEVFNKLNRAVEHNLKCRIPEKLPSVANKRLLRKKFKRPYLSSAQKLESTQTLGSAFFGKDSKSSKLKV